ncbi:MAG TPA: S46 family peptidase [Blastocatellia bacterium]|nr:S46 family peptidase [Blastocatellia bacterium]
MLRRVLTISLMITSLVISPFSLLADEGMWLPDTIDKLPISKLKSRGLQLNADDIYSTTKASLKDAVVQLSIGCTGSFVSPEGLILTNHHCAFEGVTQNSTVDSNLINNGFLAPSRDKEIQLKGYSVSVTQEYHDVTNEVLSAVKPEMSPEERDHAINARKAEIAKAALGDRAKEGYRTQVMDMTSGLQYFLYTYLTVRDVRLVYAPPKSIGFFGGDPDNFEWPRHAGDFAYLRAYVGPDGKPADFNQSNVPFKPKKFLPINATGVKEGDFTMIMGYPGATYRYRESYSIEFREKYQLPDTIAQIKQQVAALTEEGQKDPAAKIRNADRIFSLNNTLKAFEGAVQGLRRMNLAERKRAQEAEFTRWLESNPAAKAKYGNVLPQIAATYADLTSFYQRLNALNQLSNSADLIGVLGFAYQRALDQEKPAAERAPQFSENGVKRIMAQIEPSWKDMDVNSEAKALAGALAGAAALPAEQRIQFVEQLFAGKSGNERRKAEEEYARKLIEGSQFKSFEAVTKLMKSTPAEIRAIDDPALKLAIQVVDETQPLNQRQANFNSTITKLRPEFVRGMLEMKKGAYYPDANFTLRFTYGEVKGYKPRDAVTYDYQTSLGGVIDKDTGEEPFNVPQKLKELRRAKDFGTYFEPRLNDVPVDFLTTTDITGGNSGSPVMNGKGEVIGLAFDGNYEGLGGDYAFEPSLNRTLAVDIRYVLFLTEKFAGASYLFNEMQIRRGKAAVAARAAGVN